MRVALVQCVASGVDDVRRRIEIRFADLEMDNIATLCLQSFCLHQHFEGSLGSETRHALCETKFMVLGHKLKSALSEQVAQLVFKQVRDRGVRRSC